MASSCDGCHVELGHRLPGNHCECALLFCDDCFDVHSQDCDEYRDGVFYSGELST